MVIKNSLSMKIEYERLFGENVDIFKNYYIVTGIRNILDKIGVKTSHDSDWFRAVSEYVTSAELEELYNKILTPASRKNLAESRNYRTPPEIGEDDPDDIISYLAKKPVQRKKMWRGLSVIYQKRQEEYRKFLEKKDRTKSAVEIRFEEMKELFELSEKEVHLITAVFLSQTRACELGDFDITRYNSGERSQHWGGSWAFRMWRQQIS